MEVKRKMETMDGNTAAAHVAYAFTGSCYLPYNTIFTNGRICR